MEHAWITTREAAAALGISERAVRLRAGQGLLMQRITAAPGGGRRMEVSLNALPELTPPNETPAVSEVNLQEHILHAYEKAPFAAKAKFDKWNRILTQCRGILGRKELELFVRNWNAEHPELATSAPAVYRHRALVEQEGLESLLLCERPSRSKVDGRLMQIFASHYLTQGCLSTAMAWQLTLGQALSEGYPREGFPSQASFMRKLEKEYSPATVTLARYGPKKYEDRYGFGASRDYSAVGPGEVWVGDTRTWDIMVNVDGKIQTCYITLFICMRTYMPLGWYVHSSAPSTLNTLRALRTGIDTHGIPHHCYLDNGREYRNRDFSGLPRGTTSEEQDAESLAARLGFGLRFAQVQNARAKVIERQFLVVKNSFDRLFATFKGGNVVEKPESVKDALKRGAAPDFAEFKQLVDRFLTESFPALRCEGQSHMGKSRAQLWNELTETGKPLRRISPETSAMITTMSESLRIQGRGVRVRRLDCWYYAEWMVPLKGKSVILRYDPDGLNTAWGYDQDGRLLGTCYLISKVGAFIATDDKVAMEDVRALVRARKDSLRAVRGLVPDPKDRIAVATALDHLNAGLASVKANPAPGGLVALTRHDADQALLSAESRVGRGDMDEKLAELYGQKPSDPLVLWEDHVPESALG